ncbi:hypothetical protein FNH22_10275 [Fulvivirga sp. M361]|uniref:hypothetical protein n=1 Tax=Fulvivirga sp. M361 TaxID=2594266 RepID=UPI00117B724A|nr:hypothetical protein [Fulvivirga sp. M361]TRX59530.1 hypothetical protein FNH22_10275 [Fulvivirga sp. M361]
MAKFRARNAEFYKCISTNVPSSDAASLGIYGVNLINAYTAVFSFSIPIYELKGRYLSFLIPINYSASGPKIDKLPALVVDDWSFAAGWCHCKFYKENLIQRILEFEKIRASNK